MSVRSLADIVAEIVSEMDHELFAIGNHPALGVDHVMVGRWRQRLSALLASSAGYPTVAERLKKAAQALKEPPALTCSRCGGTQVRRLWELFGSPSQPLWCDVCQALSDEPATTQLLVSDGERPSDESQPNLTVRAAYVPGGWSRDVSDAAGLRRAIADGMAVSPIGEVSIRAYPWPPDAPAPWEAAPGPTREVITEAVHLLRTGVRPLDCGVHFCRYCPAKSPEWAHSPFCPYVESQKIQDRAAQVATQLAALSSPPAPATKAKP